MQRLTVDHAVACSDEGGSKSGFECVHFDPPYASGLHHPVLSQVGDCLRAQGEVAMEYSTAH
ncbi:MAG: hypothetical protein DCF15_13740 [Phormidesmis priestleyi]|uniref:Uncharacterized protein n=1 Tax=Phormidesmis priestleyi TaxID=268141 RepID=A0A2W4Z0D5_9CYAN|nr:MAG: hypothetical protein DCF15_13740 [Phormidesmis priestleyi]